MALRVLNENVAIGFRSAAGGWKTSVVPGGGGSEYRNQVWASPRRRYEFAFDNVLPEVFQQVMSLVDEMRGQYGEFLMKDWANFQLVDEVQFTAVGGETSFQIRQTWGEYDQFSRDIKYLVPDTLVVKVDGTPIDNEVSPPAFTEEDGEVTLASPLPAGVISVDCEFRVKVRFEADTYYVTVNGPQGSFGEISGMTVIEVR